MIAAGFAGSLTFVAPALADLGAAARTVPAAELVGEGRLRILGFRVFDAKLYAPNGRYDPKSAFALQLTYLRDFPGDAIARETIKEIQRQGFRNQANLDRWGDQLTKILPNVKSGQSITGVRTADGGTLFYFGDRLIGRIDESEFTERFFSIWLGNNTRNPELRARLVGASS
ncbi:hypothetical protein GCM10011316_04280 [Roseibium aquae]|uniref:Chalcone isomerase domain-containing protein n=2 Tax=Roseibium aquae TaxID=1323746 RepID=A0A916WV78_9HYPH|nr:hypothetical protein GCM10011316_04280 [Roseibium aquae]